MTTIRPFRAEDLFKFNHINLDPLTETYNIPFYMQYVATWPSLCASFEDPNGRMMGYILGKAEGDAKLWHGHVTAVTVSPEYRRLGVAKNLMAYLVISDHFVHVHLDHFYIGFVLNCLRSIFVSHLNLKLNFSSYHRRKYLKSFLTASSLISSLEHLINSLR